MNAPAEVPFPPWFLPTIFSFFEEEKKKKV